MAGLFFLDRDFALRHLEFNVAKSWFSGLDDFRGVRAANYAVEQRAIALASHAMPLQKLLLFSLEDAVIVASLRVQITLAFCARIRVCSMR